MFSLFPEPQPQKRRLARPSRKRAVVVGLNYVGTPLEQTGNLEDARKMADALFLRLFCSDMKMLCDAQSKVTKAHVLEALDWLLDGAESGDVLLFYFAGKSSKEFCMQLDEQDGVKHEEFQQALLEPMPLGTSLFSLFDSGLDGFNLRFRFEGKSAIENFEVCETSASVLVLYQPDNSGNLTTAFLRTIDTVYLHSLPFEMLLARVHAYLAANNSSGPKMESGQLLDAKVPFGRYVSAPI
jgi:hypothetical protein